MTLQSLLENKPPIKAIKRAVWDNDKYLIRIPTEEINFFVYILQEIYVH